MRIKDLVASNERLWNTWTRLHLDSNFYDMESFRQGRNPLSRIELEELGDVRGRSMVHLQCHFGQDTLAFARMGAHVTGVDFSRESIAWARRLSEELGLDARFECARVEDAARLLGGGYDLVFTSYGVLSWLPDLGPWATAIADLLLPGGDFYMVEFHPVLGMFDDDGREVSYPYLGSGEPMRFVEERTYAGAAHEPIEIYQWSHSLGEVITALASAGLRISQLREHDWSPFACYKFLVERSPGEYVMKEHPEGIPLLFSIKATKDRPLSETPEPGSRQPR